MSSVASPGSSDGLVGLLVSAFSSESGWLHDALCALTLVVDSWSWSRVALTSSGSRTISSVLSSLACGVHSPSSDVLRGAPAVVVVVSSSDVSTRLVSSSTRSCARCTLSSFSTTSRPFPLDSFACGEVRTGSVVDSTDGGVGGGLTRSSSTFWLTRGPLAGVARLPPSVCW